MANFLGFKQVSLASYNALATEERKNYMWLVREMDGTTVLSSAIYFGNRKYAEVNKTDENESEKLASVIEALGASVDANGDFVGFLPMEGHDILGDESVTNVSEALSALEAAIVANSASLANKVNASDVYTKDEVDSAIQSAVTETYTKDEVDNALADKVNASDVYTKDEVDIALADKANASDLESLETAVSSLTNNVYTKSEVDGKISGVWHFKGEVAEVSQLPVDANNGDVYQIGEKEYSWNGTEWVELGFNVDLSSYATQDYTDNKVADLALIVQSAVTNANSEHDTLSEDISKLQNIASITASTFSDAVAKANDDNLGKIIYVTTEETTGEGTGATVYSAGAYIVTGVNTISKLSATDADADIVGDVETLKSDVESLKADTHTTIEGDDVEE